jgi:hypothetical protein
MKKPKKDKKEKTVSKEQHDAVLKLLKKRDEQVDQYREWLNDRINNVMEQVDEHLEKSEKNNKK